MATNGLSNLFGKGTNILRVCLARALSQKIKKLGDNILNRLILDNNGLKDKDFARILIGIGQLLEIKSIVYIRNEFLFKSAEAIRPLITTNSVPHNLEELRLVNCKISAQATTAVLDALMHRSCLKKLGLVNACLKEPSCLKKLIQFVRGSRYLIDLDISWNGLKSGNIMDLMDLISENRQLQYLNISQNNLIEKGDMSLERRGPNTGEIKTDDEIKKEIAAILVKMEKGHFTLS